MAWPCGLPNWQIKAHELLTKYHDVFSLDLAELGCTHSTEHTIKVTNDTPFKEHFRQIPPLMVEEVRNHLKEILESGAIRPSHSTWCNAVVLVRKKDSGLHFCINFQCLKCTYEEGFLSITPNARGARESGRCWSLLLPGSEVQILEDKNGRVIKAIYCLHCG